MSGRGPGKCRELKEHELEDVLSAIGGRYAKRDRALIMLGCYTGFRISELLSLTVGDVYRFGRIRDSVTVPRDKMKGKRKARESPVLHPVAKAFLAEWLRELETLASDPEKPMPALIAARSPLFPSRKGGKAVGRKHVCTILNEAFEVCELDQIAGTHTLRKTFSYMSARAAVAQGKDPTRTVQRLLGHKSALTTEAYMDFKDDDRKDILLDTPGVGWELVNGGGA